MISKNEIFQECAIKMGRGSVSAEALLLLANKVFQKDCFTEITLSPPTAQKTLQFLDSLAFPGVTL